MKVLKLHIEGYRSLKNIDWSPEDLNVVIGPNGSGKSNLLRILEMIAVSARGGLSKYVQSVGGIEPLLWDGKVDGISWKLKTTPVDAGRNILRDSLTYELKLSRLGGGGFYRIQDELLGNYYGVEHEGRQQPFKLLERHGASFHVFDEKEKALVSEGTVPAEESLLSAAAGPFISNFLITKYQQALSSMAIYHDVHVHKDAEIRKPAVSRTVRTVEPDGQNLIAVLHTLYSEDRDFKKEINTAMRTAFGDDFDELIFPPAADQAIQLRVRWKSLKREQSAADLSDGTLRFLLLLTILATPNPPALIAIDEPETGLHPSMLPIVAEYAIDASRRTQVVLTTHSAQFLDSFGETKPLTTVTRWAGGQTELRPISGNDLEYWLREYTLGSLFSSGELEQIQ